MNKKYFLIFCAIFFIPMLLLKNSVIFNFSVTIPSDVIKSIMNFRADFGAHDDGYTPASNVGWSLVVVYNLLMALVLSYFLKYSLKIHKKIFKNKVLSGGVSIASSIYKFINFIIVWSCYVWVSLILSVLIQAIGPLNF